MVGFAPNPGRSSQKAQIVNVNKIIGKFGAELVTIQMVTHDKIILSFAHDGAFYEIVGSHLPDKFCFTSRRNVCATVCLGGRWSVRRTI